MRCTCLETGNRGEVWSQLYGRMRLRSEASEDIRAYWADVELCAERPWVKGLSVCLPGGALQSTVLCEGEVKCISLLDDGGKAYCVWL